MNHTASIEERCAIAAVTQLLPSKALKASPACVAFTSVLD
jgi:hypothetical protein